MFNTHAAKAVNLLKHSHQAGYEKQSPIVVWKCIKYQTELLHPV